MATPAAIGVYVEPGERPDDVAERAWRGVYHHWDGYPSGLGDALLKRILDTGGDLDLFRREVIDAVDGWSSLWDDEPSDDAPRVSFEEGLGQVAFCYVLDEAARRMDVFAVHADAGGQRVISIAISSDGAASPPSADTIEEELVDEGPRPRVFPLRPKYGAAKLERALADVFPLEGGPSWLYSRATRVDLVRCELRDEGVFVVFRACDFDDGALQDVYEYARLVVPNADRSDHARVDAFIEAFKAVAPTSIETREADELVILFDRCVLARSSARTVETFERLLRTERYLG